MFQLGERHKYYLYTQTADMRKGFDGLSGIVRNEMGRNPLSGDVYIFINRTRNRMKLLVWEVDGLVLYYKRLERGSFELMVDDSGSLSKQISWQKLLLLVKGIILKSVQQKRRYSLKSG